MFSDIGRILPISDISGGGVAAHSKNRRAAILFLEHLVSAEAQTYFADGNSEYPVVSTATTGAMLAELGTFKEDQLNEQVFAANNAKGPGPGWKPMPVPDGLDYEMWPGPASQAPYHMDRCLYRFRFILDYSGGQTTNFGAHSNDVAHWALGLDNSGPVEIDDTGAEFPEKGDLFNTPTKVSFRAHYANGMLLDCNTNPSSFGVNFAPIWTDP